MFIAALLCAGRPLDGAIPVHVATWDLAVRVEEKAPTVLASRTLADRSRLVVMKEGFLRLSSDGVELSRAAVAVPAGIVRVDAFGGVLVLDTASRLLRKLDGTSGSSLWGQAMPMAVEPDLAFALELDPAGNAFVLGTLQVPGGAARVLRKVSGATGQTLWAQTLEGDGELYVYGQVVVEPTGDPIVGVSWASGRAISRLSAEDGSLIWRTPLVEGEGMDVLQVNPWGEVFSGDDGRSLLKLDGRTGARLWLHGGAPYYLRILQDVHGGATLAAGQGQGLTGLGLSDGAQLWGLSTRYAYGAAADDDVGIVLAERASGEFRLRRLAIRDGSELFPAASLAAVGPPPTRVPIPTTLSADADVFFSFQETYTWLASLDGGSNEVRWGPRALWMVTPRPFDSGRYGPGQLLPLSDGDVILAAEIDSDSLQLIRLDPATGVERWRSEVVVGVALLRLVQDAVGRLVVVGWATRLASSAVALQAFDSASGATLWGPEVYRGPDGVTALLAAAARSIDSLAFVVDSRGVLAVVSIDTATGQAARAPTTLPPSEGGVLLEMDAARNLVCTGYQAGLARVTKLTEAGAVAWSVRLSTQSAQGTPTELAVEPASGDAILLFDQPARLLRLSSASGTPVFSVLLQSPYSSSARLVLDPLGGVLVATGALGGDFVVERRNGHDGAFRWSRVVPHAGSESDVSWLATRSSGEVVVAGTVRDPDYLPSTVVTGLDAQDGQLLWESVEPQLDVGCGELAPDGYVLFGSSRLRRFTLAESIQTEELPTLACGRLVSISFSAVNAESPVSFTLSGGELPTGLSLQSDGRLVGTPLEATSRLATIRASDARGSSFERTLRIVVGEGDPVPVRASVNPVCPGESAQLWVDGSFSSYRWSPGGETTPKLQLSPGSGGPYGVVVTGPDGCRRRGSVTVTSLRRDARPPDVVPPDDLSVLQSACAESKPVATPETCPALAAFLGSGSAADACDASAPARDTPLVGGQPVKPDTVFPIGPNEVTFRFHDSAGNEGRGKARLIVMALGDLDRSTTVDVFDLVTLAAYLVGNIGPGSAPFLAPSSVADVDGSGSVDVFDLIVLAAHLVGNVECLGR